MSEEELRIFAERYVHFSNLHTVYRDLLSGHYKPSLQLETKPEDWVTDVSATMMFMLYSYFYSMVEDREDAIDGFRIWRWKWPEEENAIAAVQAQVVPFRERLRVFRNRLGFHGSRSRAHQEKGFELFIKHSGMDLWNAMADFKSLAAALFAKDLARRAGNNQESARKWIDAVAERARSRRPAAG